MTNQTALGELPAGGGTAASQRASQADHGTTLTLQQAAARSGLSVSTWRRRIKAGKAAGVYLAPSPVGDEWRIPVATVEAAASEGRRVSAPSQGEPAELVALRERIHELEQLLAVQRALADERRTMLDQLHATVRALGVGIEGQDAAPRRKRWGRN
jgi:glutathione S-transferase